MQSDANDAPNVHAPARAVAQVGDGVWKKNDKIVGMHVNAMVLILTLMSGQNIDPKQFAKLDGMTIRQLGRGEEDMEGNDVSGYIVVSDAGAAILFNDSSNARRWSIDPTRVNCSIAPSLTYISSGNTQVNLLKLT